MRVVGVILVVGAIACGDPGSDGDGGTVPDASIDGWFEGCHYDCFGYGECSDGVVTTWEHAPVPCEEWTGECPHGVAYECERGCRTVVDSIGPVGLASDMCEENRPKHVGDPCTEETHCRPAVATVTGDGSVTNVDLTCDLDAGECVERDPPTIADLYQGCGMVAPIPPMGTYSTGVAETDACSGGVCAYAEEYPAESCIWQTCTARCTSDGEYPPGTICDDYGAQRVCLPPDWSASPITCQ